MSGDAKMKIRQFSTSGQVMILFVIIFVAITLSTILSGASPLLTQLRAAGDLVRSTEAQILADAGAEDVVYRLKTGQTVSSSETITLNGYSTTVTVTDVVGGKTVVSASNRGGLKRTEEVKLLAGTGVAFFYGVQVGTGGVDLLNSSEVRGNLYSNGAINGADNYVRGSVISAGATGLINGVIATGSAFAHTITSSKVCGDANYQSIDAGSLSYVNSPSSSNCSLPLTPGTAYPGSADQPTIGFPIGDSQITQWKNDAEAGDIFSGCVAGLYKVESNTTLGPIKIPCDLELKNGTLTFAGHVWVTGNIEVKGGNIDMDPALGASSVAVVADNPGSESTSGKITFTTSTTVAGSGDPNSFVVFISQNNSSETGGSTVAVDLGQTVSGNVLVYAAHGKISIGQSSELREVTAHKIELMNTASVIYQSGLANLLFTSGPSGGYTISSWKEI